MPVRIAAVDPLPMFAEGIAAVLARDGHSVETPGDVVVWARGDGRPVVLLALLAPDDWLLLTRLLRSRPDAVVVTFVDEPDTASYARALTAGAAGVLPRNAAPADVRDAFRAALREAVLLPVEVARALVTASRAVAGPASGQPAEREIGWLRRLRQGATVAQLAGEAGYSERMMFRHLAELYARLGVPNRTAAIVHAREQGWI